MSPEPWLIHSEIADQITVAWFSLTPVTVHHRAQSLDDEITDREAELRKLYPDPASTTELLAPARALYRKLGLDPSRHRPASEALLRRIVQGKGLYP